MVETKMLLECRPPGDLMLNKELLKELIERTLPVSHQDVKLTFTRKVKVEVSGGTFETMLRDETITEESDPIVYLKVEVKV